MAEEQCKKCLIAMAALVATVPQDCASPTSGVGFMRWLRDAMEKTFTPEELEEMRQAFIAGEVR